MFEGQHLLLYLVKELSWDVGVLLSLPHDFVISFLRLW